MTARVDTIEHCSFTGPDRKYGPDFDPSVVGDVAAAGMNVGPTMNVHALTMREPFAEALEKVIMGLYPGSALLAAPAGPGPR